MVRYIKQKDQFRCVPVAVVNAEKWAGRKGNGRDRLKFWCRKLRIQKNIGTYADRLDRFIDSAYNIYVVRRIPRPKVSDIYMGLHHGKIILLKTVEPRGSDSHAFLIVGKKYFGRQLTYKAINFTIGTTMSFVNREILKTELERSVVWPGQEIYSYGWVLGRKS